MRLIAALLLLLLTVAAAADQPCHQIVVPTHQKVFANSIHAATIYADTHLHIVEVPTPALVFQSLTAYIQPVQIQQVAAQPPAPPQDGVGNDEQLAALLGSQPLRATSRQVILSEIVQKCGACHSGGAAKGGLTLLDGAGEYSPTTTKSTGLTKQLIAARARSSGDDAMPPGVLASPQKRLSEDATRFLEQ